MTDNQQPNTTIIHENNGGGGWLVAIVLLVLIAVGGWYAFDHFNGQPSSDINVQVELPNDIIPDNQ